MLKKYKNCGWKKVFLIFGMCDEVFSINCTVNPPEDVDKGWFMLFVTWLGQLYWVSGATLGALLGLGGSFLCLFVFGSQNFMLPAMVLIVLCFTALRGSMIPEVEQ